MKARFRQESGAMDHTIHAPETQEQKRQRTNLARMRSSEEILLGSNAGLPWSIAAMGEARVFRRLAGKVPGFFCPT